MRLSCLLLCLIASSPIALGADEGSPAQKVYKTVDEDGRVTYTDKKPSGERQEDQQAELPPVNTMEKTERRRRQEPEPEAQTEVPDYQLTLVRPEEGAQVPPGQRDLLIQVQLSPELAPEHRLIYYMDDETLNRGRQPQYLIEEIFRGTHRIRVAIVDQNGTIVEESDTRRVHVHRPSLLLGPRP